MEGGILETRSNEALAAHLLSLELRLMDPAFRKECAQVSSLLAGAARFPELVNL